MDMAKELGMMAVLVAPLPLKVVLVYLVGL
jgi:hypothetical protein